MRSRLLLFSHSSEREQKKTQHGILTEATRFVLQSLPCSCIGSWPGRQQWKKGIYILILSRNYSRWFMFISWWTDAWSFRILWWTSVVYCLHGRPSWNQSFGCWGASPLACESNWRVIISLKINSSNSFISFLYDKTIQETSLNFNFYWQFSVNL